MRLKFLIFILLALLIVPAVAEEQKAAALQPKKITNLHEFSRLMVLDGGRIKPIDTYAQNFLLRLSGKRSVEKENASTWFARFLFAAETTKTDKIFLINHPSIATALGIKPEHKRRYSFAQLEGTFEKLKELADSAKAIDSKKRDIIENEIIRLYDNITLYAQLSLSLSFAFPHEDFMIMDPDIKETLGFSRKIQQFSFLDIAQRAGDLQQIMLPLEQKPSSQWTDEEQEAVNLVNNLLQWSIAYQGQPFTIIPAENPQDETWHSPWDKMQSALAEPEGRKQILALGNMMISYWNGEQLAFDLAAKTFNQSVDNQLKVKDINATFRINLEVLFNQLNLFFYAKFLYLLAFFVFLINLSKSKPIFYRIGSILVTTAFALHFLALLMRVIILQRPPVSNLYETFIFVGFIGVLCGLLIEWRNQKWMGLIIGAISGFTFLTIASKFSMEGDTLQVLVAVLNSNFWLGTHVISITVGYAVTCVAGIIGHIYILQSIFKANDKELLNSTYRTLVGALGFALTMTFLGTNLGGIWADQSWGRFWGWDPKENGALLIIIWTAILFHAKVGRFIGPLGLAIGSVIGIIVVMWAWFGVNLLSIGLHSYGFTSGLATNLTIYVVVQVLFLVITIPLAQRKLKPTK